MNLLLGFIKKSFLWSYARNTWQWDVLCVLILVFIFLTPKNWFVSAELQLPVTHQNEAVSTGRLGPEAIDYVKDKAQLEQHVRTLSAKSDASIVEVRTRQDNSGRVVGYEVDIR